MNLSFPGSDVGRCVYGFAHRGARLEAPENTIDAFSRALSYGLAGLDTDCWLSADAEVVCVHDAHVRRGLRRISVRRTAADELAEFGVPRLADVYAKLGTDFHLSIDAKHSEVIAPLLAVAEEVGASERLWLCHPQVEAISGNRGATRANFVHSRRRSSIDVPLERHAFNLAAVGIRAMNFHHTEWTSGLVSLFHRFGVLAFAWDVQEERHLAAMLAIGVDGLYCDRPERLRLALDAAATRT